ncbi:UNVERIFIED_CONTAM: hypothetical protein GTU68_037307 [Idotea baltica]|nr:hypothetical protein [Idotea baltica]
MAFAFAATQGVSPRHNEAVSERHRPRLNRKSKPRLALDPSPNRRYYVQERSAKGDLDAAFHDVALEDETLGPTDNFDDSRHDDADSDLNEQEFCNNNNEINYSHTKLNESNFSICGSPVEAYPSSLIKWPLDSCIKSKRLADIRKQVKHLSSAIKMTIDSDGEQSPESKARASQMPFSSLVDTSSLQSFSDSTPCPPLPSAEDFQAMLKSGKMKEMKEMVRESNWNIDHPIRNMMWMSLVQHISKEEFTDSYYWETVQQMYGSKDMSECHVVLPAFVDHDHMATHCLTTEGIKACERVISVIAYNYPAITYAPLIYPLTAMLMHYMEEPDVYNCMTTLLSKSSTFISQTKVLHESLWRTVEILAKKHERGPYSMLHGFGLSPEQINEGFQNWTWWMFSHLPNAHLIRIMDCFLLEGSKVLLRCSLAVFHLFMKQVGRDSNMVTTLTTKGMAEAMAHFCRTISASPRKLLKTAFGIRAFSKSEIKKIITQTEMMVKSDPCMGGTSGSTSLFRRSNSMEGLPTSESQENIQMMSHTLDIKELLTIWSWIPMRMTMHHPKLVYTTEEHGSSLTNFYLRVDKFEPTLLLVRTTKDEVFGAYCSTAWQERNRNDEYGHKQTYFGTGESFLFTLKPRAVHYEWVGITQQRENSELSSVAHQSELFMHADNDMVSVGGGHGHGLMLDHDLQYGKTENCETFNNPPLCSTPDFEIKVVEVYSLGEAF